MKKVIKKLIGYFFVVLVLPLLILYYFLRLAFGDGVFYSFSQSLSLVPGKVGSYMRVAFYRYTMTACDTEVMLSFSTLFSQPDINIGKGVYIGPQCNIGQSSIGEDTLIASGVHIMSGKAQHNFADLDVPIQQQGGQLKKITIGEDCWIGNGSLIMANIGRKCIVGAGSVVVNDVPDFSIVVGNPARVVKKRK